MAHPVDIAVGARVRDMRIRAGISQTDLGNALGVSFQQIQKYEKGANRMGASRLVQIATALNTSVASLFEGIDSRTTMTEVTPIDDRIDKEASKIARDYARIEDGVTRQAMRAVMNQLAKGGTGDGAVPIRPAA